jgi:Sec-independent protein translocase protein TatA
MFGLKGPDWVIVALLAGTFVSDTDTLPERMRSLAKASEQYDRLSAQAKDALGKAVRSLEEEQGRQAEPAAQGQEQEGSDVLALVDLARRLGVRTEGKTSDEISDEIARMALAASRSL